MTSRERLNTMWHLVKLHNYYERLKRTQPEDGTWDWLIKREMDELRADLNKKAAL